MRTRENWSPFINLAWYCVGSKGSSVVQSPALYHLCSYLTDSVLCLVLSLWDNPVSSHFPAFQQVTSLPNLVLRVLCLNWFFIINPGRLSLCPSVSYSFPQSHTTRIHFFPKVSFIFYRELKVKCVLAKHTAFRLDLTLLRISVLRRAQVLVWPTENRG